MDQHQSRVPERCANATGGLVLLCFLDLLTAAEEACDLTRYRCEQTSVNTNSEWA
jgi:hypothetical protein